MLDRLRSEPFAQAAAAYLLYACVYLGGAIARLSPDRKMDTWGIPWWAFYVGGTLILLTFPVIVWRKASWFTRVLAFFPMIKALTLLWRQGIRLGTDQPVPLFDWMFAAAAMLASVMLLRAGWGAPAGDRPAPRSAASSD